MNMDAEMRAAIGQARPVVPIEKGTINPEATAVGELRHALRQTCEGLWNAMPTAAPEDLIGLQTAYAIGHRALARGAQL